ncbi:MAG: ABC transporter permease [Treponema sp.]|jgi:ribose transport system permease protein|nr:ABC transporter permease [Treponema sp.]
MLENESGITLKRTHKKVELLLPSIIAIIVLMLAGNFIARGFISMNNISSILMTSSLLALMSISQNTVIIAGNNGIDLSIGATASCTALICPLLPMDTPLQFIVAISAALVIGAIFGSVNGFFVSIVKIPALIMTIIMGSVISGTIMVLTRGQPSANISMLLKSISGSIVPPIRKLTFVVIIIVVITEIILTRTKAGRMLKLVGDNQNAARITGINVKGVLFLSYVISGSIAGFMGLLIVGYAGSTTLNMAVSYTLLSMAAITIGGTSLSGGQGSYVSGALGSIVLIELNSILQALNMGQGMRLVIQGGLLLVIMMFNIRAPKLRT